MDEQLYGMLKMKTVWDESTPLAKPVSEELPLVVDPVVVLEVRIFEVDERFVFTTLMLNKKVRSKCCGSLVLQMV